MSFQRVFLSFATLVFLLTTVTGCSAPGTAAGTTTTTTTTAVTAANLNGTWLLLGSMPSYFTSDATNQANVAVSFGLNGTSIIGSANVQGVCSSGVGFGEGFVGGLMGTVNADGSFTATIVSTESTTPVVTLKGTVPTSPQGSWAGTFSFNNPSGINTCAANFEQGFQATSVPAVSGTYAGVGQLTSASVLSGSTPAAGTNYTLSMNLVQNGISYYDGISGTLQIAGVPCFSHGTSSMIGTALASDTESNVLNLLYTMDDGATVQIPASISNTAGTQIAIQSMYVSVDGCAGEYYFSVPTAQNTSTLLLNK